MGYGNDGIETITYVDGFIAILSAGRRLMSSNHHDRVYGFLGLAPTVLHNSIKPDYSITVNEVYCDAAFKMLKSSASLELLQQVTLSAANDVHSAGKTLSQVGEQPSVLPSWVPDWRVPWEAPRPDLDYLLFSAGGDGKLSLNLTSSTVLNLRAMLVDHVRLTSPAEQSYRPEITLSKRLILPSMRHTVVLAERAQSGNHTQGM